MKGFVLMNNQKSLLHISKNAFLSVFVILLVLVVASGILTHLIPAGSYDYSDNGSIIENSYRTLPDVPGYPIWKWFLAPFMVFGGSDAINIIAISIFLLILGGTFTIMDKTGGIHVIIKKLILRYQNRKYVLLRLVILVFMLFGAFFGIFEESMALLPIMILLSLSLGWDTLVGVGMCLLAAGFGFASAITNPFSVGIATELARTISGENINLLSGVFFRLFVFAIMYLLLSTFLVRYAKKVETNPERSPMFEEDKKKARDFDLSKSLPFENENLIFKSFTIMFVVLLGFVVLASILDLVAKISVPTIPLMALTFLIGGITSGFIVTKDAKKTWTFFANGALGVAPAILLILLAASVKHIITEAQIMDTILHTIATALSDKSPIVGVLIIYALVLFLQFFIGSASAKAFLIMPLLVPLAGLIGITNQLAILAFIFGDGYTNVIFPTNGVLLIGLSIASVGYAKWFKWTAVLQLITLVLTTLLLILAYYTGYGTW